MLLSKGKREALYQRYLACCNAHNFQHLDEFVAKNVVVNGQAQGLAGYRAGLEDVVKAFPDYHWNLQQLFIEGDRMAVRFIDAGTHKGVFMGVPATGKTVTTSEFAFYRWAEDKIIEVWVTADNIKLLNQLNAP